LLADQKGDRRSQDKCKNTINQLEQCDSAIDPDANVFVAKIIKKSN
jgi:hypothetical protein